MNYDDHDNQLVRFVEPQPQSGRPCLTPCRRVRDFHTVYGVLIKGKPCAVCVRKLLEDGPKPGYFVCVPCLHRARLLW